MFDVGISDKAFAKTALKDDAAFSYLVHCIHSPLQTPQDGNLSPSLAPSVHVHNYSCRQRRCSEGSRIARRNGHRKACARPSVTGGTTRLSPKTGHRSNFVIVTNELVNFCHNYTHGQWSVTFWDTEMGRAKLVSSSRSMISSYISGPKQHLARICFCKRCQRPFIFEFNNSQFSLWATVQASE